MMARCKAPPLARNLDVAEMARRKLAVFGAETRALMLERAAKYQHRGHYKTALFWEAVADKIDAIAAETADL
jgi:hypothetical protein